MRVPLVERFRAGGAISPLVLFPAIWLLGIALAQIHLLQVQRPWSTTMWLVVAAVPIAFILGGMIGGEVALARAVPADERQAASTRAVRAALAACVALGWLEEIHQWVAAKAVPLLSSNIDAARFRQPGGLTIVLTDLLTVAAIVSLTLPRNPFARSARFELGIAFAALAGFLLAGGRGTVVLPVVGAVFARLLYWGMPRARHILAVAVIGLVLVSGLFYIRTAQHRTTDAFSQELYQRVLPSTPSALWPLVPIDIGIATNYEALARIVDYFPSDAPFGHGLYDAAGLHRFIHNARYLVPISQQLSSPWVTTTVAGPFWADGGMAGVVVGTALIGLLTTATYWYARRTRELRHALVAGYFLFLAVFGFYANIWTQQVDWLLVAPLLFALGSLAERRSPLPGHLGGWAGSAYQGLVARARRGVYGFRHG